MKRIKALCLGFAILCLAAAVLSGCEPRAVELAPAFPGAQGAGAAAVGGRGGSVIYVTNLNDAGPGSLRDCATASGRRTCVFRVGGTITLRTPIVITHPYLTIAGQTAPGGGILIRGTSLPSSWPNETAAISIETHNVIVRYLRIRVGQARFEPNNGDALHVRGASGEKVEAIMLDHLSLSWGSDENFDIWSQGALIKNVSLSWSIDSEGLDSASSYCAVTGGNGLSTVRSMKGIDFHHNYFAHCRARNPYITVGEQQIINNVIYDWGNEGGIMMRGGVKADIVSNLIRPGRSSSNGLPTAMMSYPYGSSACVDADCIPGNPSIYITGNASYVDGVLSDPEANNWPLLSGWTVERGLYPLPPRFRRATALPAPQFPVVVKDVRNLVATIMPTVGASRRLDCQGYWVNARDSVDTRVVNDYSMGTGTLVKTQTDVGGFPTIASGTACSDADRDGMPDVWEIAHGLNPNDPTDRNTVNANGYTNLEKYLAGSTEH